MIRSARRTRTVQARIVDGRIEVRIPAAMTAAEEEKAVGEIVAKLKKRTTSTATSDADLVERAHRLNRTVLEGRARVGSVRWVGNQNARWGSCSVATADIRISDRLRQVPDYVLDAVLVHLLAFIVVEWVQRRHVHALTLPSWPRVLRWILYTAIIFDILYFQPPEMGAFIYFQF